MKNLLAKEMRLAMHPTNIIFLSLSTMLLIPNYPYYVIFFYTTLGIFFLCLLGRENHDIDFSLALPVRKTQIVEARIGYAVIIEVAQALLCIPFAILRSHLSPTPNEVGMDANIALFGLSFLMMGLFNLLFFPAYYRAPAKVGKAYVFSSIVIFLYIGVAETAAHAVPFFRDRLDTPDPQFLPEKLLVLGVGLAAYILFTWAACRISAKRFIALDL
ncbi:MAG: ABC-2 transporter permease [Eubacteriales bacterium]|nr:ABC-2 transporter permease [Eubacteriales bacterium]